MRILTFAFRSSAEFLSHYSPEPEGGAIFCRTRTELDTGDPVLMEISFPGLPNRALLRGSVIGPKERKGVWVTFDAADASTRDFLLGIAHGDIEVTGARERSHSRFPTALPAEVDVHNGGAAGATLTSIHDLGAGGAFVQTSEPPPVGTSIRLRIGPTDTGETFEVSGSVAWIDGEGEARGFGVRFAQQTSEDASRLRVLLRKAAETGRASFVAASKAD